MRFASLAITAGLLLAACTGPGATTRPSTPASTAASSPAPTAPSTTPSAAASTTPTAPTAEVTPPAASEPASVSGNVDIHGSSTVSPISNAVAEDFQAANPEFSYVVGDEGTGDGFELFFCVDNSDISDASRAITDTEVQLCADNGVDWVELKVAYDGLAVITHPGNAIECLNFADLYALMGPESDAVANWNDAEELAHQLGSTTDLPDVALSITAPGDESGTYDSFIEIVMGDFMEEREQPEQLRSPGDIYVASSNDNAIVTGIGGFPTSLGFVGLAYATENADAVKIVAVDGGEGCVLPSAETVVDGTYPIARPLFIYPNLGRAAENAALVAYVDFYLSDEGIANAPDVGYVALSTEELEATRATWEGAKP